jgi:hypothetical protein
LRLEAICHPDSLESLAKSLPRQTTSILHLGAVMLKYRTEGQPSNLLAVRKPLRLSQKLVALEHLCSAPGIDILSPLGDILVNIQDGDEYNCLEIAVRLELMIKHTRISDFFKKKPFLQCRECNFLRIRTRTLNFAVLESVQNRQ